MKALMGRALSQGARRLSMARVAWDISGPCEAPVPRDLTARPEASRGQRDVVIRAPRTATTLQLDLELRCRRCAACLRFRSALWAARAIGECRRVQRTWFSTLTLAPHHHYQAKLRAIAHARSRCVEWETLDAQEQFIAVHNAIGREITKYLKRLRKECGPLRYLLVCEAHQTGLHHYHLLMHEIGETTLRERSLRNQWKLGFSRHKLIPPGEDGLKAARYVAKYLGKSVLARVRASQRYGDYDLGHTNEVGARPEAARGAAAGGSQRSWVPPDRPGAAAQARSQDRALFK